MILKVKVVRNDYHYYIIMMMTILFIWHDSNAMFARISRKNKILTKREL